MRIAEHYYSDPTSCQSATYGEGEDYTVNVTEPGKSAEIVPESHTDMLRIYPNPVHGDILNVESNREIGEIYVYSIRGVLIKVVSAGDVTTYKLNVSNLKTGVYLLKILNNSSVQTQRFVVR